MFFFDYKYYYYIQFYFDNIRTIDFIKDKIIIFNEKNIIWTGSIGIYNMDYIDIINYFFISYDINNLTDINIIKFLRLHKFFTMNLDLSHEIIKEKFKKKEKFKEKKKEEKTLNYILIEDYINHFDKVIDIKDDYKIKYNSKNYTLNDDLNIVDIIIYFLYHYDKIVYNDDEIITFLEKHKFYSRSIDLNDYNFNLNDKVIIYIISNSSKYWENTNLQKFLFFNVDTKKIIDISDDSEFRKKLIDYNKNNNDYLKRLFKELIQLIDIVHYCLETNETILTLLNNYFSSKEIKKKRDFNSFLEKESFIYDKGFYKSQIYGRVPIPYGLIIDFFKKDIITTIENIYKSDFKDIYDDYINILNIFSDNKKLLKDVLNYIYNENNFSYQSQYEEIIKRFIPSNISMKQEKNDKNIDKYIKYLKKLKLERTEPEQSIQQSPKKKLKIGTGVVNGGYFDLLTIKKNEK